MKRLFASIVLSLVSLAIFIVVSIFGLAIVGELITADETRVLFKPVIFVVALVLGSLPWVFAAHLTSEEDWKTSTKLLYFLVVFLATPSFILPAIAFALAFVAARVYFIKREVSPYRQEAQPQDEDKA